MSGRENRSRGRGFWRGGGRGRGNYRQGGYRGGYDKPFNKRSQMPYHQGQKRTKFTVTSRLKEVDIGVTEFLGKHEHFSGIVKGRFNDFHVHEINQDGDVSKLTNQDIPPEPEDILDMNELKKNLPQETIDQIESLSKDDADVNSVEIDVTDMDKDQRRVLHVIGKKIPSIISQTIEKDQKKLLVLAKSPKKHEAGHKFYRDVRPEWNYREGDYCHFILHKVNMDTMDALNQMAMYLRLKTNSFTYAGTKDRRARTTQWISLRRVKPAKIHEACKRVRGVFVGNFKFSKTPLKLGQLTGNHFTIALRNVTAKDEEVDAAMTSLRDNGFINYYGLQRFGTVAEIPTHDVGKALLQSNWEEAIDLILKPRSGGGEFIDMAEARDIWANTKDPKAALEKMQRHDKLEAKLLTGLINCGKTNPQGALDSLPRNARTMYTHSYQSFVWNHMVSRRIREFGNKPIVGDLVYEESADVKEEAEEVVHEEEEKVEGEEEEKVEQEEAEKVVQEEKEDKSKEEEEKAGPVDECKEDAEEKKDEKMETETEVKDGEKKVNGDASDEPLEKDYHPVPPVKALTEEDLANYTLADVVMPQPGWRVVYPSYAKEWYEEFLAKDGLTCDLRQKNKKYSLGGQYRKILEVPKELTWRMVHYSDLQADLIPADIDEMRNHDPPKDDPEGKYKALILKMILKPSTYATMALREVLKHDTSAETQAAQSAAHHAEDQANRKLEKAENEASANGEDKVECEEKEGVDLADEAKVDDMEVTEPKEQVDKVAEPIEATATPDKE